MCDFLRFYVKFKSTSGESLKSDKKSALFSGPEIIYNLLISTKNGSVSNLTMG